MTLFTSLDIETTVSPNPSDRRILCAAIAYPDASGQTTYETFQESVQGSDFVSAFCLTIFEHADAGRKIVSWNGAAFDFPGLAQHAPAFSQQLRDVCMGSFDPCARVLCGIGYPVGLDACAKHMLGETKRHAVLLSDGETVIDNMSGAVAEKYWHYGETDAVIEYLKGDVDVTLRVMHAISQEKTVRWMSKKGKPHTLSFVAEDAGKLLTVADCLAMPMPNTDWMDTEGRELFSRQRMYEWLLTRHDS
jgi:hypothetical protein